MHKPSKIMNLRCVIEQSCRLFVLVKETYASYGRDSLRSYDDQMKDLQSLQRRHDN